MLPPEVRSFLTHCLPGLQQQELQLVLTYLYSLELHSDGRFSFPEILAHMRALPPKGFTSRHAFTTGFVKRAVLAAGAAVAVSATATRYGDNDFGGLQHPPFLFRSHSVKPVWLTPEN